jgi:hypothetical protein
LREAIELAEEDTLATRLIAAINVASTDVCGDGLDTRPVFQEKEIYRCQLYLEHYTQISPYDSRPTSHAVM